jgi:hypothetical protein
VKPVGGYAVVTPKTDAKAITYVGLSGENPLPNVLLADKRVFVFPTRGLPAGRYKFLAVASLNDEHASLEFTVIVGDAPLPGPVPPSPLPDGPLGLRKASRDGLAKVPGGKADAKKLATAQRSVASAVMAGGLTAPADILAAWREANRAAVADPAAWSPWAGVVSPVLAKLYADGKLADKTAWSAAFNEISLGLED